MAIKKELTELLDAGVISRETADKIRDYYQNKPGQSQNRLLIVFGILGAILIGLGIILIIAHNWDQFSRSTKTTFAFIPILAGQIMCGFTILKKRDSTAWREGASAFLFFAIGAGISLVSQVYNIPGNISSFMLTWTLLSLPMIYLMQSSVTSLFYLIGITYYAGDTGYWTFPNAVPYIYWLLLLAALPHYYRIVKHKAGSNFTAFHHWLMPLSVIISLGTIAQHLEEWMFIAYMSLFGIFIGIGNLSYFNKQRPLHNGYLALGSMGTIVVLLMLSFDWFWEEMRNAAFKMGEVITSPEFVASFLLTLLAGGLIFYRHNASRYRQLSLMEGTFMIFILLFLMGMWTSLAVVLVNILMLSIGILTIRQGAHRDHLGILNYGLLIITALVVCRFFDTDLSFVLRGLLFVAVGISFFVANYTILKKRKAQ